MLKYFLEIKNRLILLVTTWFSTVLISYFYKEILLFLIIYPSIFMNINEDSQLFYFIFTDVTEVLSVYFELIKFLSFQILYIYIFYHAFIFFAPAFFYPEYLYFKFSIQIIFFIWLVSGIIATYFFIPITWTFFLSFQTLTINHSFNLYFEAKLKEYFYFYTSFYYICEFYCQFFVFFLLILNYIKILWKFRKFYYYGFIVFSTLISPPDIVSQIFLSIIFVIIYEFLFLFSLLKTHLKLLIN